MKRIIIAVLCMFCVFSASCGSTQEEPVEQAATLWEVPGYFGEPYVEINNNIPEFSEEEMQMNAFEYYGDLDEAGRCAAVEAMINEDLMPTGERGQIGQVKPTGWHTVKYDNVEGKYLYNRCHLIGYQLTAENANEKNLITGTRYMNTEGMLPFENMVADYIKETGNHVIYRVNPVFEEDNLVASGVQMEAKSVEDDGEGICFNVFVYNVQPGIEIDYLTGESRVITDADSQKGQIRKYILNKNTKKFHLPDCQSAKDTDKKNKEEYKGTREDLIRQGYSPCGKCHP